MDRFRKTETRETCWMGPIKELGYMLEAFKAHDFVGNYAFLTDKRAQ